MNKWSDINPPKPDPKKEEKVEIDWLEEANTIKRKCRVKTKSANVIYPPLKSVKIKNYTEAN